MKRNAYLSFSEELVKEPIVSHLIKKYDVDVNILEARINANEAGSMFVQIIGSDENLDRAFGYLLSTGVDVNLKPHRLAWKEKSCVSCGACLTHCPTGALSENMETGQVTFEEEKCIACFLCIPACPFNALEKTEE